MFYLGMVIGLFIGAFIGVILMGILAINGKESEDDPETKGGLRLVRKNH